MTNTTLCILYLCVVSMSIPSRCFVNALGLCAWNKIWLNTPAFINYLNIQISGNI